MIGSTTENEHPGTFAPGSIELEPVNTKNYRILIVEDNRDSREMLRTLLETLGNYELRAVETAAEALELDRKQSFDLYILDIWLPGMDGLGLCRRLRERGRKQPILFFSAMVQPTDRDYVMAAGANDFLVKPKDFDRFVPTVERLLRQAGSSQSS
jgi:two-component system response regulator MprA